MRPQRPLSWTPFKIWLADTLDRVGPHLLRLKGKLTFDGMTTGVILQAVHHTFYPVIEDPSGATEPARDFLVLIFDGPVPVDFAKHCLAAGLSVDEA